jgi:hypothetical protein
MTRKGLEDHGEDFRLDTQSQDKDCEVPQPLGLLPTNLNFQGVRSSQWTGSVHWPYLSKQNGSTYTSSPKQ